MKFLVSRALQTTIVLWIVITGTFFCLRILPGGPFDSENQLPQDVKAHLESRYHLNQSFFTQYVLYLKSLGLGDLGTSYHYVDENVSEMIKQTLPVTLKLGVLALTLSFFVGVPLGLVAARFHNSWIDYISMIIASGSLSLPTFLVAPLLILIFSFWIDLLPPALWESPKYYILPVITLGIRPMAMVARLVRAGALETIQSDYVRTARSKGLSETKILFKHILKNSIVPVIGISGPLMANILSGSFIVEVIFAVPGLAHHFIDSVSDRDYPLVLALTIIYTLVLSVTNLIMDLAAGWADPRIKIT